jgi:hypothetical protein
MISALSASMVGSLVLAAAVPLPRLNVEPSCRAAAERAADPSYAAVCLRKEQEARNQIERQWNEFTADDRVQCVPRVTMAGRATYTELLTCLEMARDVRRLRAESAGRTTGQNRK